MSKDQEQVYADLRAQMVRTQIDARGVNSPAILNALNKVPRHLFVPEDLRSLAYSDRPLPIGFGQTISQPFVVAHMIHELAVKSSDRVLEIGTGSGYQTAILAELSKEVFTIELYEDLSKAAQGVLSNLGYTNIFFKVGDGYSGWKEGAPFDVVILSAAPENIPRELVHQLALGGRMILPLGGDDQCLVYLEKTKEGLTSRELGAVRFVPMVEED